MDILDTVQIFSVSMEFSIKGHLYLVGFKDLDGFFVQRNWQRRTRILRILALETQHLVIAVWIHAQNTAKNKMRSTFPGDVQNLDNILKYIIYGSKILTHFPYPYPIKPRIGRLHAAGCRSHWRERPPVNAWRSKAAASPGGSGAQGTCVPAIKHGLLENPWLMFSLTPKF